jgi:flavin reductase (DIM6/NTAB) family NADH-FMN oxidoreductase RutF
MYDPAALAPLTIDGHDGIDPAGSPECRTQFRNTLGQFATGVTAMTTLAAGGERVGITVNSFNSLSLDPPLILWSIARSTPSYSCFQVSSAFIVNVLSADQQETALRFARAAADKFEGVKTIAGMGGVPMIEGCVAYLECLTEARYPGGDHDIIVGRVKRIFNLRRAPLLFHGGVFCTLPPV